ncbi:MAG: transporter [Glaciihabitans sp.]|nr:transporter [Glaciihabitans sp.]
MEPNQHPASRVSIVVVGATYAAQGFGFALMVTSFPAMKLRFDLSDSLVSVLLLSVAITAAVGSILANYVSVRQNSKTAMLLGLGCQVLGLAVIGSGLPLPFYVVGVVVYGVGLGAVDAAAAMQGVLAQRGRERPLLGRFFAVNTLASITATLLMAAVLGVGMSASFALLVAAGVDVLVIFGGSRMLLPEHASRSTSTRVRAEPLPLRPILIFGTLIFAAFTADSAVSSWSSVYLGSDLGVSPAMAPLGYGVYLVFVLLSRVGVDYLSRRIRGSTLALAALALGTIGCAAVALLPSFAGAMIGFALIGTVAGSLVPITFTAVGRALPARSDELVARVNLFNYAGGIVGAVLTGLVGDGLGLGLAFLLPLVVLALAAPAALALGRSVPVPRRAPVGITAETGDRVPRD